MLDIRWMRENREALVQAMEKLNDLEAPWELALELDARRRETAATGGKNCAKSATPAPGQIGVLFREKKTSEANALKERMGRIGDEISRIDEDLRNVESSYHDAMMRIPNPPEEDVPVAPDEEGNVVLTQWGHLPEFDFTPQAHWDLGPELDIIDFERGVATAGSRFYFLKGPGARLQRVLTNWFLDVHIREHGYTEVYPPMMVRGHAMEGTGNLPKFGDNLYRDAEEDYWFIPTAEVSVTNPAPGRDPGNPALCRVTMSPAPPVSAVRRCRRARTRAA